jgi:glucose-1-phosphate adenylyltransferase
LKEKKCIAMLLAGGQGSRLYALTREIAKPAVPYGGKYRIIDFPLSNCVNSGIDTVGVLTQYQPLELSDYIGNGNAWDLDRMHGGVHILPPYQKATGSNWYLGTANAVYQNINFIKRYNPSYVLVLSGDHIYKMDYSKLIAAHQKNSAACTISVLEVPIDEASRFGIININPDGSVYEFEEKPKEPKSNLASMGIYVFSREKLLEYLERDAADEHSGNDFGGDVIPAMLAGSERVFTCKFDGYWKDVGTIESLWEANMDLIDPNVPFDLWEEKLRILGQSPVKPPHYVSERAQVQNAIVAEGCRVDGSVDFSVLFEGVTIERDAVVRDSIIMPGALIKSGSSVQYTIVAENAVVGEGARVGERPENVDDKSRWGIAVVASGCHIGKNAVLKARAMAWGDVEEGDTLC